MSTSSPAPADFRPLAQHRAALSLIVVAVMIIVISLVFLLAHQRTTGLLSQNLHTVFWYFDVGREYNMATWYNSGLWLLMGVVAAVIACSRPVRRGAWWLVAAIALFASVDEYLEVHERLDLPADRLLEHLPFDLGFSWVLFGAPIALVIGLLLLRLVLDLPARVRNGLIFGAALFLLGAIGVESVNGMILAGNDHIVNNAFIYGTMLEELLEMSGVAIAFASMLGLFQRDAHRGVLRLDPAVLSTPTGGSRPVTHVG
ncbi:MAG: hypothetical protein ACTHWF_01690 [Brachybacterium sp.]